MREIKFRVFSKADNEFLYSDRFNEIDNKIFTLREFFAYIEVQIRFWDTEISELMESTLIKDKNGIEIYQDDILKLDNDESFYVVDSLLEFGWIMIKFGFRSSEIEIVGNTHENPEFMETKL